MGEVVHYGNAVDHPLDFLAAGHAFKAAHGIRQLLDVQSRKLCGCNCHGGVADVELSNHRYVVPGSFQCEMAAVRGGLHIQDTDVGRVGKAHRLDGARGPLNHVQAVGIVRVDQGQAVAGDDLGQPAEAQFDFLQGIVNIRVIKFNVVDDHQFREVVQEFGTLVEKRRVVLVPLQHGKIGIRKTAPASEIAGNAANHEAGVQPGILHQPRQHGCGGGFSVGACYHIVALAAQEVFLHRLREGKVTQAPLEHGFHFLIAAAHGIADDDDVRIRRDVGSLVAFKQGDAFLLQKSGHGGIDVGVGTGDGKAAAGHGGGYRAHGGAADAEKVEMAVHDGERNGAGFIWKRKEPQYRNPPEPGPGGAQCRWRYP